MRRLLWAVSSGSTVCKMFFWYVALKGLRKKDTMSWGERGNSDKKMVCLLSEKGTTLEAKNKTECFPWVANSVFPDQTLSSADLIYSVCLSMSLRWHFTKYDDYHDDFYLTGHTCATGRKIIEYGKYVKVGHKICTCAGDPWFPNAFCAVRRVGRLLRRKYGKTIVDFSLPGIR